MVLFPFIIIEFAWSLSLFKNTCPFYLTNICSSKTMHIPQNLRTLLIPHSRHLLFQSVQFSWVAQSCPALCNPMNCSKPDIPVHHQFPEFTQTHVHRVSDAIQPSHPLSSPSSPAPNPSQHQSFPMSQLFTSGGQSIGVAASAAVLPMNIQDWSPLGWTGWISLQSKGLSRVFSNTAVQKHQFFSVQLSL